MRNLIIARKEEQRMLQNLKNERTAQFLAVYGRRRVGKTFLIREYFEDSFTFKHTALSPLELKDINPDALYKAQLAEFKKSLVRYGHKNDSQISDWLEAFDRLRELIESKNANERVIAFIDEMPWMDTSGTIMAPENTTFCSLPAEALQLGCWINSFIIKVAYMAGLPKKCIYIRLR